MDLPGVCDGSVAERVVQWAHQKRGAKRRLKEDVPMKKFIAILVAVILALSATAFAATYTNRDRDLTFEYDDTKLKIDLESETDDDLIVMLKPTDAAWGEETSLTIHLTDARDNTPVPSVSDFDGMGEEPATQGEWNGFKDVVMCTYPEGNHTNSVFNIPIFDREDGELEETLTIIVSTSPIEDEAVITERDDNISAVLDSLKVIDD